MPNEVKALLITEDITAKGTTVKQSNCFTVQHFSYDSSRRRNYSGSPFGSSLPAYLDFSVRVASGSNGRVFVSRMTKNQTYSFSFLFNAEFEKNVLSKYDDAIVASGYIVDVEESCESVPKDSGREVQMQISVRLLLSKITYAGSNPALTLTITQD